MSGFGLGKSFSKGNLDAGIGLPQGFDPSKPKVQVQGTIHDPTGLVGDQSFDKTLALPTKLPDMDFPRGLSDISKSASGGFGLPGLGMPSLPDLSLPSMDLPDLPSFGMPSLDLPPMPGLPGFRFPDLPKIELPDLDLSSWDLSLPDLIPDWDGDTEESRAAPHLWARSNSTVTVDLELVDSDGAPIPGIRARVRGDDEDEFQPIDLGKEGRVSFEVSKGPYLVDFPPDLPARVLAARFARAMEAGGKEAVVALAAVSEGSLADVDKIWQETGLPGSDQTFSAAVGSLLEESPARDWFDVSLRLGSAGTPGLLVFGDGLQASRDRICTVDAASRVVPVGSVVALELLEPGGTRSTAGGWSRLHLSPRGEAKIVAGPAGGAWEGLALDAPGLHRILWKDPRTREAHLREIVATDPAGAVLRSGSIADRSWLQAALQGIQELAKLVEDRSPPGDDLSAMHRGQMAEIRSLLGATGAEQGMSSLLKGILADLAGAFPVSSAAPIAANRLFTTAKPPRIQCGGPPWRPLVDALTVVERIALAEGGWSEGAQVRLDSDGVFFGSIDKTKVCGLVVPEGFPKRMTEIVDGSGTPLSKSAALVAEAAKAAASGGIRSVSLKGNPDLSGRIAQVTGMFSFDRKVSDLLEALADPSESLDWTGNVQFHGTTDARQVRVSVDFGLDDGGSLALGGSGAAGGPAPAGERDVRLVNHLVDEVGGIEIRWTDASGASGTTTTDPDGWFRIPDGTGLVLLDYSAGGLEHHDRLYLRPDPVSSLTGQWQRLCTLGWIPADLEGSDPTPQLVEMGLRTFGASLEEPVDDRSELLKHLERECGE